MRNFLVLSAVFLCANSFASQGKAQLPKEIFMVIEAKKFDNNAKEYFNRGGDLEATYEVEKGYALTPLMTAALYGNVEAVKFLAEKGANIKAEGPYGLTPLKFAIKAMGETSTQNDAAEVVTYLVAKGAEADKGTLLKEIKSETFADLDTKALAAFEKAFDKGLTDLAKGNRAKEDALAKLRNDTSLLAELEQSIEEGEKEELALLADKLKRRGKLGESDLARYNQLLKKKNK